MALNDESFQQEAEQLLERLSEWLLAENRVLVSAESCTGGWIAQTATSRAGSSAWFDRAYITYSNQAKQDMLGVSAQTLQRHGAVSEQTVSEMLAGALSGLQRKAVAVAVSGIAGPGGGSPAKPVGTVFIGWMTTGGQPRIQRFRFEGDRRLVRMQSVLEALRGLTGE
ncbi:MAG: damage-inducible protein CinA [Gammaproteobacteria bacterium]|nr:MAG: damage-inducible protein CinA [Gammaproteobacteria bacterium]